MNKFTRAWYILTAYVHRPLPITEAEFLFFKDVMIEAYGVKDEPVSWHCIAGNIGSIKATKMRAPWGAIANTAKRLSVNKLAQSYRAKAQKDLEDRLKVLQEAEIERLKKEDATKLTKEEMAELYPEDTDAKPVSN